ncbi:MAG: hypothetical protein ABSC18_14890, partial [Verrucomicrobiota bacterium]
MNRIIYLVAHVFLALFLLAVLPGQAGTVTWTNIQGGNWSGGSNWSPNGGPGSGDTAVLPDVGNSYSVVLNVPATVSGLVVGAANGANTQTFLTGSQTLTVNGAIQVNSRGVFNLDGGGITGTNGLAGTLTVSAGTLSGAMTVSNGSVLTLNAAGNYVSLVGWTLTNNGTVNWTNTAIYAGSGPQIYNYGLWNEQSDDTWNGANLGGAGTVFDNFGTFLKSGHAGATTLDGQVTLNNTGTVEVESGTLKAGGGGTSSGSGVFNAAGGATMEFNAGYNFLSGSSFSGTGGVVLAGGGTLDCVITNANVQLTGGTLTGTNGLAGTLTCTGGTLSGAMTVSNSGVL